MNQATLKTLANKNKGKKYLCEHIFPELTALCPTTKIPDFYTVKIVYEPNAKLIELKSLKLYFNQYRNVEIYHEELANEILNDFISVVKPRWIFLELVVNVRGGIYTIVKRFWSKEKRDEIEKAIKGM